jgi:hypothetical protein
VSTIVSVEIAELVWAEGECIDVTDMDPLLKPTGYPDRRITVHTDCGHTFNVGARPTDPVPYRVGQRSTFNCCSGGSDRPASRRPQNPRLPGKAYSRVKEGRLDHDPRSRTAGKRTAVQASFLP